MAFERIAERIIREAIADGRLTGVGDGRALDLEGYFSMPEELRMAYSVLKSAGCAPEEVELLREMDRLRGLLGAARDEAGRQPIRQALADTALRLNLALDRARKR